MDKRVKVASAPGGRVFWVTGAAEDSGVIGAIERGKGQYAPFIMNLLGRIVQPSDVCIDIGANIGVLTLVLSQLATSGQVFAFEPGSDSHAYLTRNLEHNAAANVVALKLAAYDRNGTLTLGVAPSHPGGAHLTTTDIQEATHESVPVVRLDDWAADRGLDRIDVMKIDIEGAEPRALDGASAILNRFHPTLIVECNPVALRRFQDTEADQLIEQLRSVYGTVFFLDEFSVRELLSPEQIRQELDRQGIIDLVCGDRAQQLAVSSVIEERRRHPGGTPTFNFVQSPAYEARFHINRMVAPHGATVTLPVTVRNRSDYWFSSDFPSHPVCASYRWCTTDGIVLEREEGIRTFFRRPLGPRDEAVLDVVVAMPEQPGEYVLVFALVQEAFAWFDDLRPDLAVRLPVTLR